MSQVPTMLTINEVSNRTNLPKHFIRQLVLKNEVYYLKAGNKYLVNYEKFLEYLDKKQKESVI